MYASGELEDVGDGKWSTALDVLLSGIARVHPRKVHIAAGRGHTGDSSPWARPPAHPRLLGIKVDCGRCLILPSG